MLSFPPPHKKNPTSGIATTPTTAAVPNSVTYPAPADTLLLSLLLWLLIMVNLLQVDPKKVHQYISKCSPLKLLIKVVVVVVVMVVIVMLVYHHLYLIHQNNL